MRKFILFLLLLISIQSLAQQKIELIHANTLVTLDKYGKDYQFLKGQVILAHDSSTIFCDSAVYNLKKNNFFAYRRVKIVTIKGTDTVLMSCDSVFYLGDSSYAYAYGHIKLEKDSVILLTDSLEYDIKNNEAKYNTRGMLISGQDTLVSEKGVYNTKEKKVYFSDSVRIWNDKYRIKSDTLIYDFKNKISYLLGPTYIYTDSNEIYCTKGVYYHKEKNAVIEGNAKVELTKQTIYGDQLSYNRETGYGEAHGNVVIIDTSDNYKLKGQDAWFDRNTEKFFLWGNATLIQYDKDDTIWLKSDTLFSYKDTLRTERDTFIFRKAIAYSRVKGFQKDLQLKCDSLVYSFLDSTLYMYGAPVLWSDSIQLYATTAQLTTVNGEPYQLILKDNAYLAEHTLDDKFNQIYGNDIIISFKNRQIEKVDVFGSAESIYYIFEDSTLIAINKMSCDTITIFFKNKKVKGMRATGKPSGRIIPPAQATKSDEILDGFQWFGQYRPRKPEDIYIWIHK